MPHKWKETMFVPVKIVNVLTRKEHNCWQSLFTSMYAVDMKGMQHLCKVQLCRCEDTAVTLSRYNLWPATPSSPKIAFGIRFMELLSVLQLECHLPAKAYCDAMKFIQSNFIYWATDVEKNIYRAVVRDCLTEYKYHRSALKTSKALQILHLVENVQSVYRLSKDLNKYQKKCNQVPAISVLISAKKKKRYSTLTKLKELATDRQYLSSAMEKYAEGQGIGLRISKQFSINSNKIQKELNILNSASPNQPVVLKDVSSPESPIFNELKMGNISVKKQKAVSEKSLQKCAVQEQRQIQEDSISFCKYLVLQSRSILSEIDLLLNSELCRFNLGKVQFLCTHHFHIELLWQECQNMFDNIPEDLHIQKRIHDILAIHLLPSDKVQNIPEFTITEEELKDILEEINSIENEEEMKDNDNDHNDDV